eukprot:385126_1
MLLRISCKCCSYQCFFVSILLQLFFVFIWWFISVYAIGKEMIQDNATPLLINNHESSKLYHYFVEIHRKDAHNVGDWYSTPFHYFPHLHANKIAYCDCLHWNFTISDFINEQFSYLFLEKHFHSNQYEYNIHIAIIVGGGGLINEWFVKGCLYSIQYILKHYSSFQIHNISYKNQENIKLNVFMSAYTFGVGLNDHNNKSHPEFWRYFDLYSLKIIRDYYFIQQNPVYKDLIYSQCPSSMHPSLRKYYRNDGYDIKYDICVLDHMHFATKHKTLLPTIKSLNMSYTIMSNDHNNITQTISILSQCHYVITTTYHGMVWSTLLNKNVIIQNVGRRNKFDYFKYRPIVYDKQCDKSLIRCLNKTRNYPNALNQSIHSVQNAYQLIIDNVINSANMNIRMNTFNPTQIKQYNMNYFMEAIDCVRYKWGVCVCSKFYDNY